MIIIDDTAQVCAHLFAIVLSTSCVISDLIPKVTVILQEEETGTGKLNHLLQVTLLGNGGASIQAQPLWVSSLWL